MEVTFEVWGIKKSSTKNASRVCMPSHMRVSGLRGGGDQHQWRGDSISEGTEPEWGMYPEVIACKRSHTLPDSKCHKGGLLPSAIYAQSLAHSRSSINLWGGTDEQPWVLSKFELVCQKMYASKMLAVGLYYSWWFFGSVPKGERLCHGTAVPIHFLSFPLDSPVLPLTAVTDWSDNTLVMLVTCDICVKHSLGSNPLRCSFRKIRCDVLSVRGGSSIFGGYSKHRDLKQLMHISHYAEVFYIYPC